jgi:hypothetical protein
MKMGIKPSKPASIGSLIGIGFMLLCGIAFFALVGDVISQNDVPPAMAVFFFLFMIAWISTALFLLVYHVLNIRRAKGLSLLDIETEPGLNPDSGENGPMQRLRSLEALKRDRLISEDEYKIKRAEIMKEKW